MVESGPAAGVIAAAYLGRTLGLARRDLVRHGRHDRQGRPGPGRHAADHQGLRGRRRGRAPGVGAARGQRLPDPHAGDRPRRDRRRRRLDRLGRLRRRPARRPAERRAPIPARPATAGAASEPTVTDANLVLGRLNPDYFLGGEIALDVDAAPRAIEERCARAARARRRRGRARHRRDRQRRDGQRAPPRLGPARLRPARLRAGRLRRRRAGARERARRRDRGAGRDRAAEPGIFSALGLLVTDLKHDYSRRCSRGSTSSSRAWPRRPSRGWRTKAATPFAARVSREADVSFSRQVEMRYVGQSYELTVPADDVGAGDGRASTASTTAPTASAPRAEPSRWSTCG